MELATTIDTNDQKNIQFMNFLQQQMKKMPQNTQNTQNPLQPNYSSQNLQNLENFLQQGKHQQNLTKQSSNGSENLNKKMSESGNGSKFQPGYIEKQLLSQQQDLNAFEESVKENIVNYPQNFSFGLDFQQQQNYQQQPIKKNQNFQENPNSSPQKIKSQHYQQQQLQNQNQNTKSPLISLFSQQYTDFLTKYLNQQHDQINQKQNEQKKQHYTTQQKYQYNLKPQQQQQQLSQQQHIKTQDNQNQNKQQQQFQQQQLNQLNQQSNQQQSEIGPIAKYYGNQQFVKYPIQDPLMLLQPQLQKQKNNQNANISYYLMQTEELQAIKERNRLIRQEKIQKYKNKKRNWQRTVSYDCRKRVADNRLRVKGRFISKKINKKIKSNKFNFRDVKQFFELKKGQNQEITKYFQILNPKIKKQDNLMTNQQIQQPLQNAEILHLKEQYQKFQQNNNNIISSQYNQKLLSRIQAKQIIFELVKKKNFLKSNNNNCQNSNIIENEDDDCEYTDSDEEDEYEENDGEDYEEEEENQELDLDIDEEDITEQELKQYKNEKDKEKEKSQSQKVETNKKIQNNKQIVNFNKVDKKKQNK
ncbi:hypothetical protein PPERSA_07810 [Pseudocohnilembus persalinus]|uniref:CCT domain-containing protein n=1 Tax=Pseudocohnilembus persalinus TaxID=266149 RepID=A0A0V0QBY3_PSEPJ|nr:hypothetical protein PPERSA_07810 [Pseudocohnilembus persalinus]|eukprot:KRW99733.1 hypothetical protein PPERSA_07810 [Pseudocohnilembus persalinus]